MQVFFILFISVPFWSGVRTPLCSTRAMKHSALKNILVCKKRFAVEGGGRASSSFFPLPKPKKRNEDRVVLCCKWWQCVPLQYSHGDFLKKAKQK